MPAKTDYEKYLEQKWAGIQVPASILESAVEEVCGQPIAYAERWVRSYNNEVYAVTTHDHDLVVRISRAGRGHFDGEVWTRARCAEVGVPVPRILGVATRDLEETVLSVSVEERLTGETLDIVSATGAINGDARERIVERAGALAAFIHTVPTAGWGPIDGTGVGRAPEDPDVEYFIARLPSLRSAARRCRLAVKHVEAAIALVESAPQPAAPCLIHGDFSPKHVVVCGDEVVGILDFENAQGADPFEDLGFWVHGFAEDAAALSRGYQCTGRFEDFDRRLAVAKVKVGLAYLAFYEDQPTDATPAGFLSRVARQLRSDLEPLAT